MNIDTMLRETLHSHADDAPANAGLAGAVQARSRQLRLRRRVTLTAVAAAVVVAAGLAVPPLVQRIAESPFGLPVEPASMLAPPDYQIPAFPFTAAWVPEGFGEPTGSRYGHTLSLTYRDGESLRFLTVDVGPEPSDPTADGALTDIEQEQVTVRGREGTLYSSRYDYTLVWQHAPDQWVSVVGSEVTADDLVRFADGLVERPHPISPPFTFELVPAGTVPIQLDPGMMELGSPDGQQTVVSVVLVHESELEETSAGAGGDPVDLSDPALSQPVRVGDRDGRYVPATDSGATLGGLIVLLDDELVLLVYPDGSFSRDDLITFAAGIELTAAALSAEG